MKLENSYQWLSKDERRSLFLQASSRGDTLEAQAVIQASPRVEVKMVDFSADVHALMVATVFHCLNQASLFMAITHLWEDRDNDQSFLCARLNATLYVVREEACRSISKEYGVDYDKLLTTWGDSLYLYSAPFLDWVKKLVMTKTEYKIGNTIVVLRIPTVEEQIEELRETIAIVR